MSATRSGARRVAAWLSTPAGLTTMVAVGLAVRLALADGDGHAYDMAAFRSWAGRLAERGPSGFYPVDGEGFFADYPPGYLYVLWALGAAARALGTETIPVFALKLPAILADIGLAFVVMRLADRMTPVRNVRGPAAAAVLLNPAFIFVSSVWGQVDSVAALFVMASFLLLATGGATVRREVAGMILLAIAVGTKPQTLLLVPVVIVVFVRRHLRHGVRRGIARLCGSGAVTVGAGLLLFAPFRLSLVSGVEFYARSAGIYKLTSLFAFNVWGIFGFWRPDVGEDALRIFGVPALYVGLVLTAAGAALILTKVWSSLRDETHDGEVLIFGSAALTLVAFAFLTRIHERYLFVPLALLATLVGNRVMRRAFIVLSLFYFGNLVLPFLDHFRSANLPPPWYGPIGDLVFGTEDGDVRQRIFSAVTAGLCVFIAWRGWRWLGSRHGRYRAIQL